MQSTSMDTREPRRSPTRELLGCLARIALTLVSLPTLALLIILEPFVCGALWLFSTFGVLTCLFYRLLVHNPQFTFWGGLALSICAALLAAAYRGVIRWVGGGDD